MRSSILPAAALALAAVILPTLAARAADLPVVELAIKDHRFQPERLEIPAGVKVRLVVKNLDATAEEFESHDLNREKVVPPGQEVPVFIGPLDAGSYKFFGDFHQDSAQGVLVAK